MEHYWYKNIIIYTIDVKSFCDSNADGIGDFKGLTSKLEYLSDLGITCIWLLPFFPSPWRDNGYDVSDYYSIDPRLGTFADFHEFVRKASERGINVVIDLVLNHTSNEHPWFQAARRDRNSSFYDYYVWTDVPPPQENEDHPAFPECEHGVWAYDEMNNAYYYHKFYHFQPDLFVANPSVREEIRKVMDYWLSMGISGFRMDAVPIMIHKKGLEKTKPSNSHEILWEMRRFVSERRKNAVLMGEVDVDGSQLADYFAEGAGLHLIFNFLLSAHLTGAIAQKKAEILIRGWRELPVIPEAGTWLNFLRNLDELNIQQLPEHEREKVYDLFAPEKNMRIYSRGIRRRLAPMLDGNHRRIEMSFSLLFSLPGTPMLNYGDEIGLGDELELNERESVRTPMQWDASLNAGFSQAESEKLIRPLAKSEKFHYKKVNVELQSHDPESLLQKMKKLIRMRKAHPEIGLGRIGWIMTDHPSVLAHVCHWRNSILLAVHNLCEENVTVNLDLWSIYAKRLESLSGEVDVERLDNGSYRLNLTGYGYSWFSVYWEKEP